MQPTLPTCKPQASSLKLCRHLSGFHQPVDPLLDYPRHLELKWHTRKIQTWVQQALQQALCVPGHPRDVSRDMLWGCTHVVRPYLSTWEPSSFDWSDIADCVHSLQLHMICTKLYNLQVPRYHTGSERKVQLYVATLWRTAQNSQSCRKLRPTRKFISTTRMHRVV